MDAARYLRLDGWNWGARAFDAVLQGLYATGLETATVDDVRRTVRDDQARELLYRLKLINWRFTEAQMQVVADVSPAIALPLEKFADLVGLWVQRDTETRYTVSPLIATLRGSNLPEECQRQVHLALAKNALKKRELGPEEASQAILHFVSADQQNKAASVLLLVLKALIAQGPEPVYDLGIAGYWAGVPSLRQ